MISTRQKTTLVAALAAERDRRELQDRQRAEGRLPTVANRTLFDHEYEAQVMFADLETERDQALERAEALVSGLHTDIREEVLSQVFEGNGEVSPEVALERATALSNREPDRLLGVETSTAVLLALLFAGMYQAGGRGVIQEAVRQGVPQSGALEPVTRAMDEFSLPAQTVASHPWRRITGKTLDVLNEPATALSSTVTRESFEGVLEDIKIDGSLDKARQMINTSASRGRNDTVQETAQLDPQRIWASELMDENRCEACELIDGRYFTTMEEARAYYPEGYYPRCRGGARCRGVLIFQFNR